MRVCSLSTVRNHIVLGAPLPFSVRAAGKTRLLARGQGNHDEEQLAGLFTRGALAAVPDELSRSLNEAGTQLLALLPLHAMPMRLSPAALAGLATAA